MVDYHLLNGGKDVMAFSTAAPLVEKIDDELEDERLSRSLAAEFRLLSASFVAKIPLLVIFWVSVKEGANPMEEGEEEFDLGPTAGAALGGAVVLSLIFNFFLSRINFFGTATSYAAKFKAWNAVAFAIHFGVALAMSIEIGNIPEEDQRTADVLLRYDVWTTGNTRLITEGSDVIGDELAFGFIVPVFSFVSGVQHLITAFIFDLRMLEQQRGSWFLRTLDYSISATLIFIVNLFVFSKFIGITEILFAAGLYVGIMFLGWMAEVAWYEGLDVRIKWIPYAAGMISFILSWIPVFMKLDASVRKSNEQPDTEVPTLVWIFVLWIFFSFLVFPGIVAWSKLRH